MTARVQRTLMLVKPDGVARGLVGLVLTRFENKGFRFPAMKMVTPTKEILANHYAEHVGRPYYSSIEKYMMMGPILAFVVEGNHSVPVCRKMLGSTKPEEADPGTIRFDMAQHMGRNVCHASDSEEAAEREINIWFDDDELTNPSFCNDELLIRADE
jgi:nucleoside-diphosphate kinase